ncbi:unnamed protein product [Urochloa humidicola]
MDCLPSQLHELEVELTVVVSGKQCSYRWFHRASLSRLLHVSRARLSLGMRPRRYSLLPSTRESAPSPEGAAAWQTAAWARSPPAPKSYLSPHPHSYPIPPPLSPTGAVTPIPTLLPAPSPHSALSSPPPDLSPRSLRLSKLRWPVQGWQLVVRHLDLARPGRGALRQDPGSGNSPPASSLCACLHAHAETDPASPRRVVASQETRRSRCAPPPPPHVNALCWTRASSLPPAPLEGESDLLVSHRGLTGGASSVPGDRVLLELCFHPRRGMLFLEDFGRFLGHRADGGHNCFFDLSATSNGASIRVPHRPPPPAGCSMTRRR